MLSHLKTFEVRQNLLYEFSFSLWQGVVGFNLKYVVHKNSWAENKIRLGQRFSLFEEIYIYVTNILWSLKLWTISSDHIQESWDEVRAETKCQKFETTQDTPRISMLSNVNINISYQWLLPWVQFNIWWEDKMSRYSLSCYVPGKKEGLGWEQRCIDD